MAHKLDLNIAQTAVLVIDVQVGLFEGKPPAFEGDQVIDSINDLTARARAAGAPVVVFQHGGDPADNWLVPSTAEWELHTKLQVAPSDIRLRKTTCDAFYGTRLEAELATRNVSRLVLTGVATDFCIDATLRNAVSKEFEVIVAADGHTTTDGPALRAEQIRQHFNWAWQNCTSKCEVRVLRGADLVFVPRA